MAKTIFRIESGRGFLAGRFQRGFWGSDLGSVRQIVIDGDTLNVSSDANFPIRFLGIDTPESRFLRPGTDDFITTDSPDYQALLADPFDAGLPSFDVPQPLAEFIAGKASSGAAETHKHYASMAEDVLEALVLEDFVTIGTDRFFLAFAYDALDGFGRLLAYVHPEQTSAAAADRKPSYNARLLSAGAAYPYFIFPNVDPFRAQGSPVDAVKLATDPQTILANAPKLRIAREDVRQARQNQAGVFSTERPNPFEPFELRFIARRQGPSRWLIDLSKNERIMLPPDQYFTIADSEDRLWIPEEFVPLFAANGWQTEGERRQIG